MKKLKVTDTAHSTVSMGVANLLKWCSAYDTYIEFKLSDRMKERGLTVRQLSDLSGLRLATISEIMNGKRSTINLANIITLMAVLRVDKITDIIDIHVPEEFLVNIRKEREQWLKTQEVPETTKMFKAIINNEVEVDWEHDFSNDTPEEAWKHLNPL